MRRRAARHEGGGGGGGRLFAVAVALVAFLRLAVFDLYTVPTESMSPTIAAGDILVGTRTWGLLGVGRGQIVTFRSDGAYIVKRVVALPGQVVDISDGRVHVDGEPVEEPYLAPGVRTDAPEGTVAYPHTVAEGHVWVMGDNRARSRDSRYFGDVSIGSVAAVVWLVF